MVGYMCEVTPSFEGEDRAFAEVVASGLPEAGVQVFHGNFMEQIIGGKT